MRTLENYAKAKIVPRKVLLPSAKTSVRGLCPGLHHYRSSTYYVPGGTSCACPHLIHRTTLRGRLDYHPHCTDEETELDEGNTESQGPSLGEPGCGPRQSENGASPSTTPSRASGSQKAVNPLQAPAG